MNRLIWITLGYLLLTNANSASFDCSKTNTSVEQMICNDGELTNLDADLAERYKQALEGINDKQKAVRSQRNWIKEVRNLCQNTDCLKDAYKTRIDELTKRNYMVIQGSASVCQVLSQYFNHYYYFSTYAKDKLQFQQLGDPAERVNETDSLQFLHVSATPLNDFDFDNDGFADRVFSYEGVGSYIYGSIFFVAFGGEHKPSPQNKTLTVDDIKIFPCQFDSSVTDSRSCPPLSQKADEAGIDISFSKGKSIFSEEDILL